MNPFNTQNSNIWSGGCWLSTVSWERYRFMRFLGWKLNNLDAACNFIFHLIFSLGLLQFLPNTRINVHFSKMNRTHFRYLKTKFDSYTYLNLNKNIFGVYFSAGKFILPSEWLRISIKNDTLIKVPAGASLQLECEAVGSPPPTLRWHHADTLISEVSTVLLNANVQVLAFFASMVE